jgi:hypothetical protein
MAVVQCRYGCTTRQTRHGPLVFFLFFLSLSVWCWTGLAKVLRRWLHPTFFEPIFLGVAVLTRVYCRTPHSTGIQDRESPPRPHCCRSQGLNLRFHSPTFRRGPQGAQEATLGGKFGTKSATYCILETGYAELAHAPDWLSRFLSTPHPHYGACSNVYVHPTVVFRRRTCVRGVSVLSLMLHLETARPRATACSSF